MINFENGRHLYTVGGTVQASGGLYICREADEELFALCRAGSFAYVLTARQLGKSSLMVQTAERLMAEGTRCVLIDVTLLGTELTAEKWYLGLLALVGVRLRLKTNVVGWWRANAHLGATQRLVSFFQEVVVEECSSSVVIFLDEIDSTLILSFTDDFFAAIRALYNARAHIPALKRLTFVLIGVATPSDLISEPKRTPFNIGQRVELSDFTPQEAAPLAKGLGLPLDQARQVLDQLLKWTGGHPYLTQRLCLAFTQQPKASPSDPPKAVDQVVARTFFGEMSRQDSNLQFVRDMLTKRAPDPPAVLTTYRAIRLGRRPVYDEEQSLIKNHLKLSGVVHREGNVLRVRNSIYEEVFNRRWIQEQLPMSWWDTVPMSVKASVLMMACLVVALFFSLGFAINKQQEAKMAAADQADARKTEVAARAAAETAAGRESEARATAERAAGRESEARATAETAAGRESEARATAEAAAGREREARATAEAARATAEAARATAVADRATAEAALTDMKAAQAMAKAGEALSELSNQNPNQALILALASVPSDMTSYPVPVSQAWLKTIAETESVRHVLAGHSKRVSLVAWAPDGQQVLTSSQDGSVHLWDATTGQLLNTLDTPSAAAISVAWPANRPQIVSASHVGMRIWDVATSELLFRYDSQSRPSLASHPPQELKSRRFNGPRIWEPGTNQSLNLRQREYSSGIRSVAWHPNSELVATGNEEGSLQIWNLMTDQLLDSFDAHLTSILSLAWSPNGQQVLIGRKFGTIEIWNPTTNKLALSLEGDSSAIRAVAWSPNEQKVLTGSQDGTAKIWNTATGYTIHTLKGHSGAVLSVAWSPNGEQVLTGSDDNKVRIWEAATGQLLKTLVGHSAPVGSVAWHPDGQQVITGSDDGSARIWDVQIEEANPLQAPSEVLRPEEPEAADDSFTLPTSNNSGNRALLESNMGQLSSLNERSDSIWSVAWRLDGPQLLTSGKMGAQIWDATTAQPLTLKGLSDDVWSVAWSPYGQKIVISSIRDRSARIWEVASGQLLQTLSGDFEAINSVAWRSDGEQVVTGHLDGTLRIWDAATGSPLQRLTGHLSAISSLAWSPDSQKLLTGHWDGSIQVCEVPTLRPFDKLSASQAEGTATTCVLRIKGHKADPHSNIVWSVAWSPDGQQVLSGSNDHSARIWNATTGDLLHTLPSEGAIFSVAWHPNGQQVLTGSNDHSARIWKAATGDLLHTFNLHSQRVWSLAWSPNGQQVLTSSWDGTARISIADETLLVAKLTERVCTVWHHQQDAISHQIPEWRGCEVELAAVADKLAAYDALRDRE
ncbi:MAG: AAA-like domain-containing protein [Ardenticatenaceae bacterium]